MAEIVIENVAKNFGATRVLEQISITIGDGEMLVVLGPSGCGKSTLLRMVAGLETVGSGEIRIGGRRVNELEPAQRDIAMVFQNYALYPHMTVYDNMAYGLRNKRTPRPVIETRVKDAARILGLEPLLSRRPRELSGGQRQRVAMGRAIVREPQAFLFDEPLSNLDAKLRVQMRHEIRQLQSRLRTTGLYVTHDQLEAMTLGDRLVVLNAGHIEQIGRPLEVYARPASLFVAGFLGAPAMNTQPARIGEDGTTVHMGEVVLPAPAGSPPGQPVIMGIRPEDLTAAAGETANLHLRVLWLEALGADTIAHGEAGGVPLAARIDGRLVPAIGDLLPLRVAAHALHLFAPSDGRRLALPSDEQARAA